ncbi:MAG: hypothetical protein BJ554DRAFT_7475 [Olpidium bornovanus]|uniref:Uncharacterized protein n=1 Tax=Olpidium bornovanus TaxID=278681 RepID=A0A8H7ZWE5_9FUNG|nr:MAG: hypothetical protein BJ554DRAFT_7475 [Olpidium bornovanus]
MAGYPYTEETLGADLTKVLRASPENTSRLPASSGSPQTLLLVTHVGPSECGTCRCSGASCAGLPYIPLRAPTNDASAALRRVLSSNEFQSPQRQRNVIANIHGHTHHPWGNTALGRIRIINPFTRGIPCITFHGIAADSLSFAPRRPRLHCSPKGALCDGRFAFVNLVRDGVVDGEVEDSAVRPDGTVQRQAGSAEADTANVSRNCLSEPESADKLYWRIERIEHYTHC